jgi:uncharacterized membrane protein
MTLLLAVLFMALAVDTGRLWMQQRKLQSVADIASMEAARTMGCSIDLDNVASAAQAAAVRNGYSGQLSQGPNIVELGSVATVGGIRQFLPGTPEEAVHVYATQSVPASLVAGGLFGNQVLLHAEAVSSADPSLVAFTAGSFLLSVDTESATLMNGLLGNLLGTSLNLNVLSYQGLASANLSLLNLLHAQGGTNNINELLNTDMPLNELLNLVADGVAEAGTAGSLASAALQQLGAGGNSTTVKLADILAVSAPNEDATAEVSLNAFSLITAAAMFANKNNTINLPLSVNAAPIASVDAQIIITQAPLLAVGPSEGSSCTAAQTAQLQVTATASVAGTLDLTLNLALGQGSAELAEFSDNGSESHVVIAATPGIASLNGAATLTVLGIPITIPIDLPIAPAGPQDLEFFVAHPTADNLPQTMTVASPLGASLENALQQQDILNIPLLNIVLAPLLDTLVNTLLSPLLGEIGRVLLDPLLDMLGIRLAGMDVTLQGIQLRQAKPLII